MSLGFYDLFIFSSEECTCFESILRTLYTLIYTHQVSNNPYFFIKLLLRATCFSDVNSTLHDDPARWALLPLFCR